MAERPTRRSTVSHLSIGEVLGLLLEEFPDITISKIRFLESQGLIDPERTPSGYRKFYDADVELLRCILREQRENFLPLRVIKDRLDAGLIDPTGETELPRGIRNLPEPNNHPSAHRQAPEPPPTAPVAPVAEHTAAGGLPRPALRLTGDEVRARSGLTAAELGELVTYGVVVPGPGGEFGDDAVAVAAVAKRFLDGGVDARHLRGWKVSADREAGLYTQLVQPLVRQRNPASRAQAAERLAELERLGAELRAAMMRTALAPHAGDGYD